MCLASPFASTFATPAPFASVYFPAQIACQLLPIAPSCNLFIPSLKRVVLFHLRPLSSAAVVIISRRTSAILQFGIRLSLAELRASARPVSMVLLLTEPPVLEPNRHFYSMHRAAQPIIKHIPRLCASLSVLHGMIPFRAFPLHPLNKSRPSLSTPPRPRTFHVLSKSLSHFQALTPQLALPTHSISSGVHYHPETHSHPLQNALLARKHDQTCMTLQTDRPTGRHEMKSTCRRVSLVCACSWP